MVMDSTTHVHQMLSTHCPHSMSHVQSILESNDDLAQFPPTTFHAKQPDPITLLRERELRISLKAHLAWQPST